MNSSYTVNDLLSEFDNIVNGNTTSYTFTELFSLNFTKYNPAKIASLQSSLQQYDNRQLTTTLETNRTMKQINWPAFEVFMLKYLICVRDFDPWSLLASIDLFIAVFESESLLFNPKSSLHERICVQLLPLYEETMFLVIPLCQLVDVEGMKIHNRTNDYPRLTHISSILLKSLNYLRGTPDLNSEQHLNKIDLLMEISIKLCYVYYKIGSPVLCSNVFSNINILSLNRRFIKKSKLVRYRFIMGKYYAHQSNFYIAFNHLEACYMMVNDKCPTAFIIQILKYLIPIGLINGRVANIDQIRRRFNGELLNFLLDTYEILIVHYKAGYLYGVYKCISNNENLWKSLGLWIPMIQRLRIPIFRNLLVQVSKITQLSFDIIHAAVVRSLEGMNQLTTAYHIIDSGVVTRDFIHNLLVSLGYNGYLKIKFVGLDNFVLSKNDAFPDMHCIISGRFTTNPKEAWLDR